MKKNWPLYLILAILMGIALFVYFQDDSSTITGKNSDFAVEDTAAVTKIFLADKKDHQVTLTRSGDGWRVNNKYLAREQAVEVLLETIKKIRVRAPVPRSAFENIVKNIASESVKIEIYMNGSSKPQKVYFVGGSNQEHTGTYMLMQGSDVPYLMHIEGFRGYITPRYFTNINEWRYTGIFNYQPRNIKSITIEYPDSAQYSLQIFRENKGGHFQVKNLATGEIATNIDSAELARYVNRYREIHFEGFEETKSQAFKDSIIATTPEQIYTVEDFSGEKNYVEVYKKPAHKGAKDYEDNPIKYDLDRLYGYVNGEEFVVLQYIIFDPLKKKIPDFKKRPAPEL